ncbi:MAG: hypothetical protein AVDCRST_MAG13-488, partial [uncultured Solirubrobacteraceae bacterium]
ARRQPLAAPPLRRPDAGHRGARGAGAAGRASPRRRISRGRGGGHGGRSDA